MAKALEIYMSILQRLLMLSGMKTQEVEVEPGTTIHFWLPTQPVKTKPTLVFLHGFGSAGIQQWQFQVFALAKTYSIYVPSFLFFGGSTTDKPNRSLEFQAECVAKSLEKLGVDKCVLVCLSYGGLTGFKMAEMFPGLVKSMIVSGSDLAMRETYCCGVMKRIGFSSLSQLLIPYTVEDVKKSFHVLTYKVPWLPHIFFTSVLEIMSENRKERGELAEALITRDKDFKIPTFSLSQKFYLLWGENDEIFPMDAARNLEKQLGGKASLQSIEKAGHLAQLERPFTFNKQLKKILSSIFQDELYQ
ncbi:alpha/beta-Hydrolases superfamily protein [Euphorbia peplus]|nr:alpha/beta-Hydrolases superfamily protein [Euphorbia peplus]